MPLLIDCYNVLFADGSGIPQGFTGLTTGELARRVAGTSWAKYGIVIVCDGRPKPLEIVDPPPEVEIVHSGAGRTADDVIIAAIGGEKNPRRLIVVSSDNEIRSAARRRKANSWTSEEFLQRLARQLRDASGAQSHQGKPSPQHLSEQEVDDWLRVFGLEE